MEEDDLSDDNQDATDEVDTPSKVRGHELVRDPLSTRAKRRTKSILSDSAPTPVQQSPLLESLQAKITSVPAADQDITISHPESLHPYDSATDTWTCQARGCGKVIHKSSSKRGKEMIQDHSLGHADDTQAKLDLVFAEQRLNIGLPVDNLLGRIRDFGVLDTDLANIHNGTANGFET